ncbi:MAG: SDR family oxidoreductase [Bacteroidetes bacterium]|nr:SDR family oxidoreductase [Bacteroidota bacterium]
MKIFILGATGFIGNAIFHSLVSEHDVTIGCRTPIDGYEKWKHIDFSKENNWNAILLDIDLVINAIGIIDGNFEQIQAQSPVKLFDVCIKRGIKIINISAIGAEKENPPIPFLKTKKTADSFLISYDHAKIIYPGIVLGKGARSTQFFSEMAQLPIIPLLNSKNPPTIHVSQLTTLIKDVVKNFETYPKQIFAISKPESLEKILTVIRGKKGIFLKAPAFVFNFLFSVFPNVSIGIFNKNMMTMLSLISSDDYKPLFEDASSKINPTELTKSDYFPMIIALGAISFIWIWSGISSLVSWDESYSLMKEIGANHQYSALFIYLGSIADIVLGFGVFWKRIREQILITQLLFIITYTIILSVLAPHYWLHPFGVLSKNIPLIALIYYLYQKNENGR